MTNALVLFSGGQDSTTCLAWALERFDHVETIGFDYGQRHKIELQQRAPIREAITKIKLEWAKRLGEDHFIPLAVLGEISQTAMTHEIAFAAGEKGLPNTFVPGRNLMFLTFAAAVAYRRSLKHIVTGVCETDYSGYPDCRDDTLKAMQIALNLGMESRFVIETPLMWIDKGETFALAEKLGGKALLDLIVDESHTCYVGDRTHKHAWGFGCGTCPACELRKAGWERFVAAKG